MECVICRTNEAERDEEFCQNQTCQKTWNQRAILAAIRNEFTITLERGGGYIFFDENLMPTSIGYGNVENSEEIFQAIKEYINQHRNEFRLGGNDSDENPHEGFVERDTRPRPWWSPLLRDIPDESGRGKIAGSYGACSTRKIFKGNYYIHPDALTGEQYEELKQLIPGACKVRGCCNEYPDVGSHDVRITMVGDVCQYHSFFPDHRPPFFPGKTYDRNSTGGNQNNQPQNNTNNQQTPPNNDNNINDYNQQEVENYNIKLMELKVELEEENDEIISQGQEKYGLLMSLEKDGKTEVRENLAIINEERQFPVLNFKEENPASHTKNQQIENQNKTQIDNYKNWLSKKKEAVKKLETIINQINQEENTNENPETNSPRPNPEREREREEKNDNPIVENNKNSNENIEKLSHLSLTEAKIKTKEEIKILLDRYGVKFSELDNELWEKAENWEKYLESLSDNEKVKKFVKKMKAAIIQKNNKNNQEITNLPLAEVRQKCQNQINELLQKYNLNPNYLDKSLWNDEKNWQEYLEKLTDKEEILKFTHKMREAIIHNSQAKNSKKETPNKSKNFPSSLIPILIFVILFLIGIVIIIRKRKVKRFKRKM